MTDVATVTNIFTVEGKGLDFTKLSVLNLAGQFEVNSTAVTTYDVNAAGTAATAWVAKTDLTVDDLNANLSGQGFKFAFPNAVSDPDMRNSMIGDNIMLYAKEFGNKNRAGAVIDNQYIGEFVESLTREFGY